MVQFHLNDCHERVLWKLLTFEGSFLVYYPSAKRATTVGTHWCFVMENNSELGEIIQDNVCDELIKHGFLEADLDEKEHEVQTALGTQIGRVFKLSNSLKNILKR
jgi:hypothetical protein